MATIVERVVERFMLAKGSKFKEDKNHTWEDWLDDVYEGGKKKVRNPNEYSKERFPEVTWSTAYKDSPMFQERAQLEYMKWVSKQKKEKSKMSPDQKSEADKKRTDKRKDREDTKKQQKEREEADDQLTNWRTRH